MKRFKKISVVLSLVLCMSILFSGNVFAEKNTQTSSSTTQHIIGTYKNEKEKKLIIDKIKKDDPGAIIFTSKEDFEKFMASQSISGTYSEEDKLTNSINGYAIVNNTTTRKVTIAINRGVTKVNFSFKYSVIGGRAWGELVQSPSVTYTGVTFGTSVSLADYSIIKETREILDVIFTVHTKYYLFYEGVGTLYEQDDTFHCKCDLLTGITEV